MNRNDVFKKTMEYFNNDELASNVWIDKYALKDSDGNLFEETPDDMHRRLAKEFNRIENKYENPLSEESIYELFKNFKYIIPAGSPMAGIGNDYQIMSISNCFVAGDDVEDSYGSILKTDQEIVQIAKRRGGVGVTLEHVRPQNTTVKNAALTSTGVVPFMERYSNSTREVAQCLHGDTNILTENGLKKIKDINIGEKVWTKEGFIKVDNVLKNKKSLIKVTTKFGNEIICSEDHVFSTINGEKAIKDININDEINIISGEGFNGIYPKLNKVTYNKIGENQSNRLNENITFPDILNKNLAYLIGYSYGDGCICSSKQYLRLSLSNDWGGIITKLEDIVKNDINYIPHYECFENYKNLIIGSKLLIHHLIENKIDKEKSEHIKFPDLLLNAKKDILFSFISGYFDADGSVNVNKKSYKIASISKDFLLTIQQIFYSYGIISKIHTFKRKQKNWKTIYELTINGQSNQHLFHDCMVESVKIQNYEKFNKKSDNLLSIYNLEYFNKTSNNFSYISDNKRYLSYSILNKFKKEISNKESHYLFQDFVINKEVYDNGIEHDVYDLTLNSEHLFFANGFYVHNSNRRGALMIATHINSIDSEDFINAKLDTTKITGANISVKIDDDFMEALKNNKSYIQKFPILSDNPMMTKEIEPKNIWDKLILNNWKSAEPGILFWSKIISESIPDCYADSGFKTISTNPCVVGDTKIAVADGRNNVSIKQLAEEGKDVPVYCLTNKGAISIKTMRNPRISGYNQKIYKIKIEGGHKIRVTGNHKFRLKDGSYVEAKDLKHGDSLNILIKYKASIKEIFDKSNSNSSDYYWLNNGIKNSKSEHRVIYENLIGKIEHGNVIHHKDYNPLNNSIDNLISMSPDEHNKLHSIDMMGENNPYHKMSDEWKHNFASNKGEKNHTYINVDNEEIIEHAKKLTLELNKRFSKKDWIQYAKENNLPQVFTNFRKELVSPVYLAKKVALKLGLEFIDDDPRLVDTYKQAIDNGYDAEIINNAVYVTKVCEHCNKEFKVNYFKREQSLCSTNCMIDYLNSDYNIKNNRIESINDVSYNKSIGNKEKQLKIYSDLKFNLNREPSLNEWETECKKNNIPFRLYTKHGFKNYEDLKEMAVDYNHKVISVEFDGYEDVYNGTVDEFHNYFSGGFEEKTKSGKEKLIFVNQLNCGEIPLCAYDSCRLTSLNLYSYVKNPFTKEAEFDWELFAKHVQLAERLMDDIIDLELEKVDKIIEKIKSDPESDETKRIELNLWLNIKEKGLLGRRTGLGVTAEGDMLAALGFHYGTEEASIFSEKIHKELALNAYRSSVIMAKERGKFEIFDFEKEKNNPFLNRLYKEDSQLKEDMELYGRRNIALLTIAPNGSLSILTQTTSGIEPAFNIYYKRRRKINNVEKDSKVSFVDQNGDSWEEYVVFHHKFIDWLKINGYDVEKVKNSTNKEIDEIIEKSPYYNSTSNNINWAENVKMQGRIQKYVDHSISKCITKDSLIHTDKGLFYIDELTNFDKIKEGEFKDNDEIDYKVLNHHRKYVNITSFYNNGIKPVFKVTLKNGLILKCTGNEKLLKLDNNEDIDNWKMISELNIGDRIKIK